jgi:hypothetical protein
MGESKIMNSSPNLSTAPMQDIVADAWSKRDSFDLRGIGYGRIHWGNKADVISHPFPYYYFLAGMVNLTGSRHIVEIGTHQGGSARALAAGLRDPAGGRIVTFDVTTDGAERLSGHPVIRAYSMDANSEPAYDLCIREFGAPKIDLVYIDAAHSFWPTLSSFLIYGSAFRAAFAVLDDITLNPEMQKFWHLVLATFGDDAIDATDVFGEIRMASEGNRPGFGLVRLHGQASSEIKRKE